MALAINSIVANFATANFVPLASLAVAVLCTLRGGYTTKEPAKGPLPAIAIAVNPTTIVLAALGWIFGGIFAYRNQPE
jgi:hypothetical protein